MKSEQYREMAGQIDAILNAMKLRTDRPDFRPDVTLDREHPLQNNRYQQMLLNELRKLYENVDDIIDTDDPPREKTRRLREACRKYIADSQRIAKEELKNVFQSGVEKLGEDLRKAGVPFEAERVNRTRLNDLIRYQHAAIEKTGMRVLYDLQDEIYREAAWKR